MKGQIADSSMQVYAALAAASSGAVVGAAQAVDVTVYWLGVPMPVILASFAGSCAALSFLGSLGRFRAMAIVGCSTLIGTYLTPLLGLVLEIASGLWVGLGFVTGLLAHLVGTALFSHAPGAVRDGIAAAIERIRGRTS